MAALDQAAPVAGKTLNDGVYTSAQAERGLKVFSASCGICHDTGRFSDDKFFTDWSGKSLQDLFDVIAKTMPEDNPGGLKPQEYEDVIAYLLSVNKFAAGSGELKSGNAMRAITIVKPGAQKVVEGNNREIREIGEPKKEKYDEGQARVAQAKPAPANGDDRRTDESHPVPGLSSARRSSPFRAASGRAREPLLPDLRVNNP